ncbi:beta-1,4-galactosyltransferase galt-1-like [Tachypleus tridentatus]|uniref:beta-1,4-galactosyltransferase galt-1-like n=1 Tax=Tachypleus tridentatus TaxID=6853 RepID=UPI003FCF08E5
MGTRVKTVNFNNEFISTSSAWKDTWKQVTNNIYVYSAFWDDRNNSLKNFIRIIAVGPRLEDEQRNVICSIYDQSSETLIDLAITYEIIRDNHSKNYSAMYFFCPFSSGEPTPREVVLRQASTPLELVKLPIHRRESQNSTKSQDKLAVCVRPLFGPFKNSFALAEFVAFYQILGVSHFTFYNYKTTKQVKDFLFSLQNQGLPVELLHWNLPRTVAQKTWAYGQMASTEDCIYRHMFLSKYVALVDIDEYIVPRNHQTILEMIKSFKNTTWGSLVFHNSFFCTKHPVKVKYSKQNLPFTTLRYLTRVKHVSRAYFRSKPMVQPTRVVTGGIHFVWQHFANWQPFVVPPSECLLHHYRSGICSEASYKSGVEDKTILKFKDKLLKANAIKMWMTINKRNMFP